MVCSELLNLRCGDVVSIVGCNGKTSLLYTLAEENRCKKVLLATTTHILFPPQKRYDRVVDAKEELGRGINLVHGGLEGLKIRGVEAERLCALCPHDGVTLLECDGSRGLPFKGWAEDEPVVPVCTTVTVGVCGIWRVGELFSSATVHRPRLFQALTGAHPHQPVTLQHLASMISHPQGMFRSARGRAGLVINQKGRGTQAARALIHALPETFRQRLSAVVVADLKRGFFEEIGERVQ